MKKNIILGILSLLIFAGLFWGGFQFGVTRTNDRTIYIVDMSHNQIIRIRPADWGRTEIRADSEIGGWETADFPVPLQVNKGDLIYIIPTTK